MKQLLCVLIVLFVGMPTFVCAKTSMTVSQRNEYGGKTLMVTYSPGDEEYKNGISKDTTYFDGKGKKVKTEAFYTDESAGKNGITKGITYFDSNEKEVKMDVFGKDGSLLK